MLLKIKQKISITKYIFSMQHIWIMKWIGFRAKTIIQESIELLKFPCLVTMTNYIYLKLNTVGYHIFTNILVNHVKTIIILKALT